MKRTILIGLVGLFLVGCGDTAQKPQTKGVVADQDYIAKGMEYLSEKDIPNAIRSFDTAIKNDPRNVKNYVTLGEVYLGLKNYDRAIDTLSAATRVDVNSADAFYFLAVSADLRQKEEDRELAIKSIKRSIELYMAQKNQEGFIKAMALYKNLTGKETTTN